jgi:hypothetical protein
MDSVVFMRDTRSAYGVWPGKPEGKSLLDDLGIDGRIILKSVLLKHYVKIWVHCRPITRVHTIEHEDASSRPCVIVRRSRSLNLFRLTTVWA